MSDGLVLLRELILFLREEKKWWLIPLCLVLVLLAVMLVAGESSALAPFVYAIF